jgi:hypothetical protein
MNRHEILYISGHSAFPSPWRSQAMRQFPLGIGGSNDQVVRINYNFQETISPKTPHRTTRLVKSQLVIHQLDRVQLKTSSHDSTNLHRSRDPERGSSPAAYQILNSLLQFSRSEAGHTTKCGPWPVSWLSRPRYVIAWTVFPSPISSAQIAPPMFCRRSSSRKLTPISWYGFKVGLVSELVESLVQAAVISACMRRVGQCPLALTAGLSIGVACKARPCQIEKEEPDYLQTCKPNDRSGSTKDSCRDLCAPSELVNRESSLVAASGFQNHDSNGSFKVQHDLEWPNTSFCKTSAVTVDKFVHPAFLLTWDTSLAAAVSTSLYPSVASSAICS